MVGSSITDSGNGGGGDSLYGPSPKAQPGTPTSPVPDFDDLDIPGPNPGKADSLFGEVDYNGVEERQELIPPIPESEAAPAQGFGYQATAPIDVTSHHPNTKAPDFESLGAQTSSSGDRKIETADLELKPSREGSLAEVPWDRERKRIDDWLAPADQSEFLNDMINLHGPGRFDRQVTNSNDVWSLNSPSRVIVKGGEGSGKTMFAASVIHHTLKACRPPSFRRTRDSFAYFFCATYKPYINEPQVHTHDFNLFLRTIISQLCPPQTVFESLRVLYADCTRYHPATRPTSEELQKVFIQVIQDLDRPPNRRGHDPLMPGETYLVMMKHFHLLVTCEDPVTPTRRIQAEKPRKGRGRPKEPGLSEMPATSTTEWAEVELNWNTTDTAAQEWLRECFTNDLALAKYANINPSGLIYSINRPNESFRWMYWKLNRLGKIGAKSVLSDKKLSKLAKAALNKDSDDESEEADGVEDDEDDDNYISVATRSKRRKKLSASPAKKQKVSS